MVQAYQTISQTLIVTGTILNVREGPALIPRFSGDTGGREVSYPWAVGTIVADFTWLTSAFCKRTLCNRE